MAKDTAKDTAKDSSKQEIFWVRLKPRDSRGHKLASYTVYGLRFIGKRGWYKVHRSVAVLDGRNPRRSVEVDLVQYLRGVRQQNGNTDTPLAFDICTEAEAKAIDVAERKSKRSAGKATALEPIEMGGRGDLTSSDVNGGRSAEPDDAEEEEGDEDEESAPPAPARRERSVRSARE
jgi:hypothetical protein